MSTRRHFLATLLGLGSTAVLGQPTAAAVAAAPSALAKRPRPATPRRAEAAMLRVAMPFGPPGLDPAVRTDGHTIVTLGCGETLQRVTRTGEVVPWLAETVEAVDPLRWRVRVREGVRFWNGRALDATALRAALTRTLERNSSAASLLGVSTIESVDQRTIELVSARPTGALGANLSSYFLVIYDAQDTTQIEGVPAPAMTGPFRPVAFRPRELCAVERVPDYWGGPAGIERAEFQGVGDGNARLLAALAGDVDLSRQIPAAGVAAARAAGLAVASVASGYMYHLYLNCRKAPFDDVQVRRALSLAVDRHALVERVLNGSGEVASGPFPRFYPFAASEAPRYDPDASRALLEAAGWLPGADGIRVRAGRRLAFTILTYPQRPELGLLATVIQANLREVGVEAAIQSTEDITSPVDAGEHDAAMYAMQTAPTADPGFIFNLVYRSNAPLSAHLGYSSERFDRLVDQLNETSDVGGRRRLALEAQAILNEDAPALFLLAPVYHSAHTPRLRGFEPHPLELYLLDNRFSLT